MINFQFSNCGRWAKVISKVKPIANRGNAAKREDGLSIQERGKIFPGLRMFFGSNILLMDFMISISVFDNSIPR